MNINTNNVEVGKEYTLELTVTGGTLFISGKFTFKDGDILKFVPSDEAYGIKEIIIEADTIFKENA